MRETVSVILVDEEHRIVKTLQMPTEKLGCGIIRYEEQLYSYLSQSTPPQFMLVHVYEA